MTDLSDPVEPQRPAAFDTELAIEAASATTWRLTRPLVWTGTKGDTFTVPTGFVTDFASVPRFMHWLVSPYGAYTRAAVLHDWLWGRLRLGQSTVSSRDADGIFRRVMQDLGVDWWQRWAMWAAVRWATMFAERGFAGRGLLADLPKMTGVTLLLAPFVITGIAGVLLSLGLVRLLSLVTRTPGLR